METIRVINHIPPVEKIPPPEEGEDFPWDDLEHGDIVYGRGHGMAVDVYGYEDTTDGQIPEIRRREKGASVQFNPGIPLLVEVVRVSQSAKDRKTAVDRDNPKLLDSKEAKGGSQARLAAGLEVEVKVVRPLPSTESSDQEMSDGIQGSMYASVRDVQFTRVISSEETTVVPTPWPISSVGL